MKTRTILLLTLCVALQASTAFAGPVERMFEIAHHPSNPDGIVVRYQFGGTGLLFSRDGGRSFRLLCASAIDMARPGGPITLTQDGHLLMGTFDGVWQDDGKGCAWGLVEPLRTRWITDFAHHPLDPSSTLAVTSNGGEGASNGIARRDGSGGWTDLGLREPVQISRVRATKTPTGMRIYESVFRTELMSMDGGLPQTMYAIRVSDDEGKTWREHPQMLSPGSVRIEAIDPSNPDRILVSASSPMAGATLFVSSDQGTAFTEYLKLSAFGGVTFAPDGRLWIGEPTSTSSGGASRGLWFAKSLGEAPAKVADFGVECLSYQAATQTLLTCQPYSFGKVDVTTYKFEELFRFAAAKEFVSCDGVDMKATCRAQLCNDYCGAGHFANAPLCCVYNETDSCGPAIAVSEGTAEANACPGVSLNAGASAPAGSGASAGATSAAVSGSSAAGVSAAAGNPTSAGGAGASTPNGGSGCSLRAQSGGSDGLHSVWVAVVGLLGWRWRRRARRPLRHD